METHADPDIATDSSIPGITQPPDLNLKAADEVYDLLGVPSDIRQEIIERVKGIYRKSAFPDVSYSSIPKTARVDVIKELRTSLAEIHPNCGQSWFAAWALWWEHTKPVDAPGALSKMKANEVYSLLRVGDRTRRNIITCTGLVYTNANFPDVRYNHLDKNQIQKAESELTTRLRVIFPDIRRGEPWFPNWALWRRHKTRPESRKKAGSKPRGSAAGSSDVVNFSEADGDDDEPDGFLSGL